ncbi:MAG: hypothetical protein IID14_01680 [Candidatus Marinimicrobia bacterium]|nr:hypothetical protein [Candidatus Neomarinimicrobiota bacterium]
MKKIFMGLAAALMLFVLLIVVFSVIFFFTEADEVAAEGETIEVVADDGTIQMVPRTELQGAVQEQDPLKVELDSLKALLATVSVGFDSLEQLLTIKDATVRALEDRLQVQDAEIVSLREVDVNAQQMARTFATMTVSELSPIVSQLGDKVVLDIYKHTTNKRRKFLLSALGVQRAAELTNRLVKREGS